MQRPDLLRGVGQPVPDAVNAWADRGKRGGAGGLTMDGMKRRDVVLHDDGSLSYTVDGSGGGECRVTIGPPSGEYEPVFAEQAEWLRRRRAEASNGRGEDVGGSPDKGGLV